MNTLTGFTCTALLLAPPAGLHAAKPCQKSQSMGNSASASPTLAHDLGSGKLLGGTGKGFAEAMAELSQLQKDKL